jgi:hypothetical protein
MGASRTGRVRDSTQAEGRDASLRCQRAPPNTAWQPPADSVLVNDVERWAYWSASGS